MSDLARSIPTLPGRLPSIGDARTMAARCIRLSMRNLDALLTSLMLPVMLMLVFVYLFGGAIETGTEYVTYVVPGVILLCAGFGSATTAVTVSHDMTGASSTGCARWMSAAPRSSPGTSRPASRATPPPQSSCSASRS